MNDFDYSKISVTAKLVAFFRNFSDIPFASEVAESVHAEQVLQAIASTLDLESQEDSSASMLVDEGKVYAPLLEARYKSIVQLILKSGYTQILELASGFSLRGLAMTKDSRFVYVESDLQGVNDEKIKLVNQIRSKYSIPDKGNHHLVTANALIYSELEQTLQYFSMDQPLVIVNEGLIQYLSEAERDAVADNVRKLLAGFKSGLWITPDFSTRQSAENISESTKRFRQAITGATNRQLYAAAFETDEALEQFISAAGFSGHCSNQLDEIESLTSVATLGLSPKMVEHIRSAHANLAAHS